MSKKGFRPDVDAPEWKGGHQPYDIIKEGTIALIVVALLTVVFAVMFGSPDDKEITIKTWANAAPLDFAQTALGEMNGTTTTAGYGAPYNTSSTGQTLGPLQLAKWAGVRIPINTEKDFVIRPLETQPYDPTLSSALTSWKAASSTQQTTWVNNFTKASNSMKFVNGNVVASTSDSGPVPVFINDLTHMARSGALDADLISGGSFFTTDYTKPLLFLSDGGYLAKLAQDQHLLGSQWGMMNETNSYPGQAWLWLYTFWYQITPFSSSSNADVQVWGMMMLLSVILLLVPVIPGLRALPRKMKVYRLIWREHYRDQ